MRQTELAPGLTSSAIGLGCSSMSHGYSPGERDDRESARVIARAVDLGVTLFDTADVYGPFRNEELLGATLRPYRDRVRITTKCGLTAGPDGRFRRNGRPDYLRSACEGSLRRLQVEAIDVYQLHRVDPAVPLAETWGALGALVAEGKVRHLGISHATVEELDLVHAVCPLSVVQYELSVWCAQSLQDVIPWCRRNGVGFLAFAPLGRGYLSGTVRPSSLSDGDSRVRDPRFQPTAMRANQAIVDGLTAVGARHGVTAAQVAIAWTLALGEGIVPIPGTRHRRWLEDNVAAAHLRLTGDDLRDIAALPAATGRMRWDDDRYADRTRPAVTTG
ncbi:aldo/keto reductase [Micromonospora sp. WMMD975]|uniref:aldo/keto reductase n=1 Tax=Micromonospora sp. WMMD975 TaxID=3016087 RepID=UPI00249CF061|nr:aldo/keto reductase [Micromonospora sp. WMMD975]WFE36473.1 aldo/keto reductase [Micromonospora sp. WMMD975]